MLQVVPVIGDQLPVISYQELGVRRLRVRRQGDGVVTACALRGGFGVLGF